MPQEIANPNVAPNRYPPFWWRILEIIPGLTVWVCLLSPFILAFYIPDYVVLFVLIFDLFWLTKSLTYGLILILGYRRMHEVLASDWRKKLGNLPKNAEIPYAWEDIYQAVILANYKESKTTLEASIESLIAADYNKDHLLFVLACEGRDPTSESIAQELKAKYEKDFGLFMITIHPDGIVGEIKGKGSNVDWAARELTREIDKRHIPHEHVMVSAADADSRFHPQYFLRLTYVYLTTPNRDHSSYQPVATFFNNIWDAPLLSRVLAFGTTFWQLIESMRQYRLITFSTHATPLNTLIGMDYWCTSIVSEDSRQYFRGFFKYEGDYQVVPLFIPVYMDAVSVGTLKRSLKNLYFQQQRWAWGVEHFPYIVLECIRHKRIPLWDRLAVIWRAFEGNFSWATASYFITVVGWLPLLLNPTFQNHVVAVNFQFLTRYILTLTWIGLFISAYMTIKLLPESKRGRKRFDVLIMAVQWALVPVTTTIFGALPGIDAQTRLMLGKYLGFRVTEKVTD